jgi:hypothetical protein
MSNDRGQYGNNGVSHDAPYWTPPTQVGAAPRGGSSLFKWIVGGAAVGLAALWMRHTSAQIEELYKAVGLSHQSFGQSLRADARALPGKTRSALRSLTRGKRPARPARPTVAELAEVSSPLPGEKS